VTPAAAVKKPPPRVAADAGSPKKGPHDEDI
jgi:hypothetical protein